MLLTLGLDSSFGGSEDVITALSDEFPILANHRELFVLGLFSFYCIIRALESTQGGIYLFHLFERMCVEYPILLAVFCETMCVSWIYGVDRFRQNIKRMLGFEPGIFWKITWKFIAPLFIMFNIVYGLTNYRSLQLGDYTYPLWANIIGWMLSGISMLAIPAVAVYQLCKTPGAIRERFRKLIQPCPSMLVTGQDTPEAVPTIKITRSASEVIFIPVESSTDLNMNVCSSTPNMSVERDKQT
ncbi:unnamed protein product [Dicrocoelium dendriticum]|nr:unnamed protein product [Dicrocoelium dendriticum]